jgi:predicted ATPase
VAEVTGRLATARLLTLTGIGGCGKTRLALEVARGLTSSYPDGVWLVELAPLGDPLLVPRRVAAVLDVNDIADQSVTSALIAALSSRHIRKPDNQC